MRRNKGFTLIEMAVVLAIIAILAAILTPLVTGYIDQARTTRAQADVTSIRDAILLFKRDTGVFPAYTTLTAARTATTPSVACLLSGSSTATPTAPTTGLATWTCATRGTLDNFLNVNSLGLTTGGPGGTVGFRGPYLDGLSGSDPWSNPYWVNSTFLATSGSNANNWAFVVSTGPNGAVDTAQTQLHNAALATGGDDITGLIQ